MALAALIALSLISAFTYFLVSDEETSLDNDMPFFIEREIS